jgi:predicted nucleic acid-binding protein
MNRIFVDTVHWIALANPKDQSHERSTSLEKRLWPFYAVTTDEVLTEFLNRFSKTPELRKAVAEMVQAIHRNPNIRVLPQTRNSFLGGLRLYQERLDKEYSLTDCISMQAMRDEGINDILTADKHFTQEGFNALYLMPLAQEP